MTFSARKRARPPRAPQPHLRQPKSDTIVQLQRVVSRLIRSDSSSENEIVVRSHTRLKPRDSVNFSSRAQEKYAFVMQTLAITRQEQRIAVHEELHAPGCAARTMSRYLTYDGMSDDTALMYLDALTA